MATEKRSSNSSSEQRSCSVFDLQSNFFYFCRPFSENINPFSSLASDLDVSPANEEEGKSFKGEEEKKDKETERKANPRCSCNTCKAEFDSLQDQRSHFKSDFHRFNVKLSVAGKDTVKEDEFGEMTGESLLKDYDISSISGSEDEMEKGNTAMLGRVQERVKQKLFIQLQSGDIVSIWRCLIFNESEDLLLESNKFPGENCGLIESELAEKLHSLIHEPRDKTHLRIVLLASGGHFAGCVFDGNHIEAHKTFHRYVVRAKAGKKQSSKDATGKAANSAGAYLRRYNEIALKKDIQELVAAWRPYFDASLCVFIHAPSSNRQLFFDGEKPLFSHQNCAIRNIPLTVRRPTLKEAKHIYKHLTSIVYEVDEKLHLPTTKEDLLLYPNDAGKNNQESNEEQVSDQKEINRSPEVLSGVRKSGLPISAENEVVCTSLCTRETTALHEAARSGDAERTLELLEQGLDPCIKDERGRTPYMLTTEKEVRNTFRRFMALNLDKWDWHAANVPSPLTKEMEESQAAKQAEKDAKRKAKSKELKKLRKVKEKAQAQAAASHNSSAIPHGQGAAAVSAVRGQSNSNSTAMISKEEELKQARAAEREKRAVAAEKRIAALNGLVSSTTTSTSTTSTQNGLVSSANTSTSTALKTEGGDLKCSCCMTSLAGKVPFHRYHYKYCSTSCMHVHREMLEDG